MEQLKGLTIRELIKKLEEVPEENKDLPIYTFENENSLPIKGISLYDENAKHSQENPLSFDVIR
ncbi:hypothetical protein [Enterococcus phage vB_EfaM_Ef2.3]|jgi:hypothetical protein|uniref:Uncharacterized protein n=3 Tax=Kochikohdavirus TaxID=2560160 RepID=A0A4D6DVH6_9CAUD|nr:hypothetical protein [Enterococcus phage ECP3]AII28559.1 hypothetical protein [Enterococcus phage ECP3]QBZ70218.1 hypothetical protein [Enterococcus phage vB_EfaM_Ef2.3]QVW28025.1 hypothetical protein [Enterococcus phage MDA2]